MKCTCQIRALLHVNRKRGIENIATCKQIFGYARLFLGVRLMTGMFYALSMVANPSVETRTLVTQCDLRPSLQITTAGRSF